MRYVYSCTKVTTILLGRLSIAFLHFAGVASGGLCNYKSFCRAFATFFRPYSVNIVARICTLITIFLFQFFPENLQVGIDVAH